MDMVRIYKLFPTYLNCLEYLEKIRWNNEPICPYCEAKKSSKMKNEKGYNILRYHCNKCNATYSVLVNTIFQDTKLDLQKWFLALYLIFRANKKLSSRQLAYHLKVNHKTAWFVQMKITYAKQQNDTDLLNSIIKGVNNG